MKKKAIVAKALRVLTVPPVMALLMIGILASSRTDIFTVQSETITLTVLLAVIPALTYPWQKWTDKGGGANREKQRNMAFVFTAVGYSAAFFWAAASRRNRHLLMICMTYLLSAAILTVCNKLLHIRASGHACGVTAPLPLCLLLAGAAVWSSLYLKRHTIRELAMGCAVCIVSLAFSAGLTGHF